MKTLPLPVAAAPAVLGTQELKLAIVRNTLRAWLAVSSTLLLLLLARWGYQSTVKDWFYTEPLLVEVIIPRPILTIATPAMLEPQSSSNTRQQSAAENRGGSGTTAVAGIPMAVPEELLHEAHPFANVDIFDQAGPTLGDSETRYGNPNGSELGVPARTQGPAEIDADDPFAFVAKEVDADVDYARLQRSIVYPEMAKRQGIEGTVTIQVLVDEVGQPSKVTVVGAANVWLAQEAIRAVSMATFTPAMQNKTAVPSWMTIPLVFKIR
jgi:TonB family protein